MPGAHSGLERASDPLELKLQMAVCCHLLRTKFRFSGRASIQSVLLTTESSLQPQTDIRFKNTAFAENPTLLKDPGVVVLDPIASAIM